MDWLPFRIHIWPSSRNKFLSGRHGLEVKASQGRHAEAIGERALSFRREMREFSSPYVSSSHCWSRCTSMIPLFKMMSRGYAIIEKRMVISRNLEQKHRDTEHSASRERPIVGPVPVAAATEERGQKEQRKRALEMGAQWISEDQCADGKFCLVSNRQPRTNRGSYSRMQCARCGGFGL